MDCSTPGFRVHHLPESPGACSNSCPLSRWCHPTISSSVVPFSSCPQSFPASGSFPMSPRFESGGQSIGASASVSVLSVNIQGWFPLGLTDLISLQSKGLSRVFSNTTFQKHWFFGAQPSLWSNLGPYQGISTLQRSEGIQGDTHSHQPGRQEGQKPAPTSAPVKQAPPHAASRQQWVKGRGSRGLLGQSLLSLEYAAAEAGTDTEAPSQAQQSSWGWHQEARGLGSRAGSNRAGCVPFTYIKCTSAYSPWFCFSQNDTVYFSKH